MEISIEKKGEEGEIQFQKWLDDGKRIYVKLCQGKDTFPVIFKNFDANVAKRPDFLLLINSIGFIAVDVKNLEATENPKTNEYEYTIESMDVRKSITFERICKIPVWYAICTDEKWYWMSALKVIEVASIRKNTNMDKEFYSIEKKEFLSMKTCEDFPKLYTEDLSDFRKLKEYF